MQKVGSSLDKKSAIAVPIKSSTNKRTTAAIFVKLLTDAGKTTKCFPRIKFQEEFLRFNKTAMSVKPAILLSRY